MLRQEIVNLIQKSVKDLKREKAFPRFEVPEIKVERPEDKAHGDYASNVAMVIAKQVKKRPVEIAELLKKRLEAGGGELFERVEVAEPGFINFFIAKEYLHKQVGYILRQDKRFGCLRLGRRRKVNIEFISANPTGELHLGHGRGAFFGDCLANVLKEAGYSVTREYFINDAQNSAQIKELGKTALGKGSVYLNEYLSGKIKKLKLKIKKAKNEGEAGLLLANAIQRDVKNFIVRKLKIKFKKWVSEEGLKKQGKIDKSYQLLKNRKLIYKKEKAEWLETSKFGDSKDWVIIRETGEPTYLLSDIAYHKDKFDRGFKKIINIWGADHQGHVGKIKAVAKILGYKGDLDILISQVVRLKGGKISKRKGKVVTLKWLIDEVGLDAARFFYLMKSLDTQMEFDVELAKERSQKSPVYYVQYAFARISSLLKKYEEGRTEASRKISLAIRPYLLKFLIHPSELELAKHLIRFPEVVEDTASDCQTQRLPKYALDLAAAFHQFYRDCRVISENKEMTQARLLLVSAARVVLKNTLDLMGISSPKRM